MQKPTSAYGWVHILIEKIPISLSDFAIKLGPIAQTCNPSKWEADIWGWLEVRRSAMIHFNVHQRPHWACRQYGHTGGTRGWLGVDRWQLCLRDTWLLMLWVSLVWTFNFIKFGSSCGQGWTNVLWVSWRQWRQSTAHAGCRSLWGLTGLKARLAGIAMVAAKYSTVYLPTTTFGLHSLATQLRKAKQTTLLGRTTSIWHSYYYCWCIPSTYGLLESLYGTELVP